MEARVVWDHQAGSSSLPTSTIIANEVTKMKSLERFVYSVILIALVIALTCACFSACATANSSAKAERENVHLRARVINLGYSRVVYGTKYDGVLAQTTRIALLKVLDSDEYTYIEAVCDVETFGRLVELSDGTIVEVAGHLIKQSGPYPDYMEWQINF